MLYIGTASFLHYFDYVRTWWMLCQTRVCALNISPRRYHPLFNYKELFSIIHNLSCWCIALLSNSFVTSCYTNIFFGGLFFKPQKTNQQKINVFYLSKTAEISHHRNYLLYRIMLQNLSTTFKAKLPTHCIWLLDA